MPGAECRDPVSSAVCRPENQSPLPVSKASCTTSVDLTTSTPHLHGLPPGEHDERSSQALFAVPAALDELLPESGQAGAPPDRKSPPELLLHFGNLLHQLLAPRSLALGHSIHRRCKEQSDRLVHVFFGGDVGKGQFGK